MRRCLPYVFLGLALLATCLLLDAGEATLPAFADSPDAEVGERRPGPMMTADAERRRGPTLSARPEPKPASVGAIRAAHIEALVAYAKKHIRGARTPYLGTLLVNRPETLETILEDLALAPWQRREIEQRLAWAKEDMARLRDRRNHAGDSWNGLKQPGAVRKATTGQALRLAAFGSSELYEGGPTMEALAREIRTELEEGVWEVLDDEQRKRWDERQGDHLYRDFSFGVMQSLRALSGHWIAVDKAPKRD